MVAAPRTATRSPAMSSRVAAGAADVNLSLPLLPVAVSAASGVLGLDLNDRVNRAVDDRAMCSILHPWRYGPVACDGGVAPFVQQEDFRRVLGTGSEPIAERLLDLHFHGGHVPIVSGAEPMAKRVPAPGGRRD